MLMNGSQLGSETGPVYRIKEPYKYVISSITFDIRILAAKMGAGRKAGDSLEEHQTLLILACSKKPLIEWLT